MASAASLLPPKNGLEAVDNVTTFSTASRNVGWFDPDDPYPYTLLTQDEIARRFLASSHLESCILGDGIRVDSVEWQPNPTAFEVRAFDLAHGPKGGRRGGAVEPSSQMSDRLTPSGISSAAKGRQGGRARLCLARGQGDPSLCV
jgi:hypothetical protein